MGKKESKNLSIIDTELKIDGAISSAGKLIIKGQVKGTIEGDAVIIAEGGVVNSSSTKVSSLTIGGSFQGELDASNELVILSTGTCAGKVVCHDLIVENGGVLNADVACKNVGGVAMAPSNTTSDSGRNRQGKEKHNEI